MSFYVNAFIVLSISTLLHVIYTSIYISGFRFTIAQANFIHKNLFRIPDITTTTTPAHARNIKKKKKMHE